MVLDQSHGNKTRGLGELGLPSLRDLDELPGRALRWSPPASNPKTGMRARCSRLAWPRLEERQRSFGMDRSQWLRSVYGKVLRELEGVLCWLERCTAGGPLPHGARRSGMFHLGQQADSRFPPASRGPDLRPSSTTSPMPPGSGTWIAEFSYRFDSSLSPSSCPARIRFTASRLLNSWDAVQFPRARNRITGASH